MTRPNETCETAGEVSAAVASREVSSRLPEHLVQLPGGEMAVWRNFGLRGAGFPAAQVLKLASDECIVAADHLLQRMEEVAEARSSVREIVQSELASATGSRRNSLRKALQHLSKNTVPQRLNPDCAESDPLEGWLVAHRALDEAQIEFRRKFDAGTDRISGAIREIASADRFREAVIWQNRQAFHTGIDPLLRSAGGTKFRDSRTRQHEEMVANYLQRYCVKNDTIGFFGPVGWARFEAHADNLVLAPGRDLIAERNVYFEVWCIDALAEALNKEKLLRAWLAPRLMPFIRLEGFSLYIPARGPIRLTPQQKVVIELCDGEHTAKQIAAEVIQGSSAGFKSESEVYSLLEGLHNKAIISWKLEAPMDLHPEVYIKRALERVEDIELRKKTLAMLDELENGRRLVAESAGDADRLDGALGNLDATFTRLTGIAPTRSAGKTYAGRTLVYEDCRRDAGVRIGPGILESLGPPLSLVLASACWFSSKAASKYRKEFTEAYNRLTTGTGSRVVDFVSFWYEIRPLLLGREQLTTMNSVVTDYQERWSKILSFSAEQKQSRYSSEQLRPLVLAAFQTDDDVVCGSRYHSPDIMVAASSVEDIKHDNYLLVMGELHVAGNTLGCPLFIEQHSSPETLRRAFEIDLQARLVPIIPKVYWDGQAARLLPSAIASESFRVAFSPEPSITPKSRTLAVSAMVVEDAGSGLVIRTRDGKMSFDVIETFETGMFGALNNSFNLLGAEAHTPRITVDRLVICRETWRLATSDLEFSQEKDESSRFIAARRFARSHGLPRFVFVKSPTEVKPFYVDFNSPIYVNILARAIRRVKEQRDDHLKISITEALPRPDQTWLVDAAGAGYTSELRMIVVDMAENRLRRRPADK